MALLSAILSIICGVLSLWGGTGIGLPVIGLALGANALIRLRRPGAKQSKLTSAAGWTGIALCTLATAAILFQLYARAA